MIDVNNMARDAFLDERKAPQVRVTFNGTQVVDQENVISAKLQEDLADQNITIGSAFSQSFELKIRMPDPDIPLTGAYFLAEASFDGMNRAKLGKFYVNAVSTTDNYKTVSITATDRMALLTDTYTPAIDFPATPQEILADITNQYNLELDTSISYANISISQLYEGTVRDYIGWIAGLSGKNARFNREGKLTFTWYHQIVAVYGDVNLDDAIDAKDIAYINENLLGSASRENAEAILGRMIVGKAYIGAKIKDTTRAPLADVNQDGIINEEDTAEIQGYIDGTPYDPTLVGTVKEYAQLLDENRIERNGFQLSASEVYTISALISGTEESPVESGAGKAISFYNPFMTKAVLDQITAKNLPFAYLAAKISYRGCPSWEVGDIIRVQAGGSWNVPIMSQTLDFGKKLSGEIKSLGLSDEEESAIRVVPDVKEVERQLPEIKQVLTDINSSLLSGTDGYMILDEEEINGVKRLSGFKLMDTPTIGDHTKGWIANKNGIGWSDDGFKTISKLGLDMANGKIYADQIAAGAIITNSFQIGDAMSFDGTTGEITFGPGVKMSWASIEDQPDIPTNLSDLNNDEGFIDSTMATTITSNAISTATIRANQVQAGSFTMTGGTIKVTTSDNASVIKLTGDTFYSFLKPEGLEMGWNDSTTKVSYVSANAFYLANGAKQTNIAAGEIYINNSKVATMSDLSGYYSSGDSIDAYRVIASSYIRGLKIVAESPGSTSNSAGILYSSTYGGYTLCELSGSSKRFKHGIRDLTDAKKAEFKKLYEINVQEWTYNDDYIDPADELYQKETFGIIAEDLQLAIPSAVTHDADGLVQNYRDRDLLNAMLYLLQEQKKEIDLLKERMVN